MIDSSQCRAARAMLAWPQETLQGYAGVSKKTIADFEREARLPHESTLHTLEQTFVAHGIEFLPAGDFGPGLRLRTALPRLFRRNVVYDREWIAFAFDYKNRRQIGFITFDAIASISLSGLDHLGVFDRDRRRILMAAAKKVDLEEFDPEGRVLLRRGDILTVEFDPELKAADPE